MGSIIKAYCRICNHTFEFKYGGSSFSVTCYVPAINKATSEFENIDYYNKTIINKYLLYSEDKLKGENNGEIFKNFNLELNEFNNYCPNCKQYKLDFRTTIYFD